jgi:hypothetical protein
MKGIARSILILSGLFLIAPDDVFAREEAWRPARPSGISAREKDGLRRTGEGTFRYLGLKLYTAYLYLDDSHADAEKAWPKGTKRLVIHYLRDIPRKALIQAAERNLRSNLKGNYEALRSRIDRLHAAYNDLKKGDTYELAYVNGATLLYHNDRLREKIEGQDFAEAYFGIWLSKDPISGALRRDLLGIRS